MNAPAMKVVLVEFLEPIEKPAKGRGGGLDSKWKHSDAPDAVTCRAFGPGFVLEQAGSEDATVVPWHMVKFARVRFEKPADEAKAAKR